MPSFQNLVLSEHRHVPPSWGGSSSSDSHLIVELGISCASDGAAEHENEEE